VFLEGMEEMQKTYSRGSSARVTAMPLPSVCPGARRTGGTQGRTIARLDGQLKLCRY